MCGALGIFCVYLKKGKDMQHNLIITLIQRVLDDGDLNPEQRAYNHEREVCYLDHMERGELIKLRDYFVNYVHENYVEESV